MRKCGTEIKNTVPLLHFVTKCWYGLFSIVEDPTVKCGTEIKTLFLYFIL
jgi:hypothetical protein